MVETFSLGTNIAVFCGSAAGVWFAGTRLARYADAIAQKTGIGREFLGLLLLGGVTSLPELAVASTAALAGVPALSINDVLGSASINVVIIALADAAIGRHHAITSVIASPGVLLQAVLGIVALALVAAATMTFDILFLGVGVWSWLLAISYLGSVWVIVKAQPLDSWIPRIREPKRKITSPHETGKQPRSLKSITAKTVGAGAAILIAGYLLASTGAAIAEQTDLGTSFFGAVFLAISTSLPEVSTVLAAVRLQRYEMALSDIFGTNLFNVAIIFLVDALYTGGPVLSEVGAFAGCAALLAIVLTALYLAGMIERRDRTVLTMGMDSLAVLACYGAGVAILYQLR